MMFAKCKDGPPTHFLGFDSSLNLCSKYKNQMLDHLLDRSFFNGSFESHEKSNFLSSHKDAQMDTTDINRNDSANKFVHQSLPS